MTLTTTGEKMNFENPKPIKNNKKLLPILTELIKKDWNTQKIQYPEKICSLKDILESRLKEIDDYFIISLRGDNLKIQTLLPYSGEYILKEFLKINDDYKYNFKIDWNTEEMELKIKINARYKNKYAEEYEKEEKDNFLNTMMDLIYMESFR